MKWLARLREWFRKPVKYRVIVHSKGVMSDSVVLYTTDVYAKSQLEAFYNSVAEDPRRHSNKVFGRKWKWWAYELTDD